MSSIIITRTETTKFTIVPNALLEDDALTWATKGVLAYLIGKPDGWVVRIGDLCQKSGMGREAVRNILKQAEAAGYAELQSNRESDGKLTGRKWIIADSPMFLRKTERPKDGLTEIRETATISKTDDLSKKQGVVRNSFTPPSLDEVVRYCAEAGLPADIAAPLWDFYESKGWKVGRVPMKDWKAAVRNWARRNGGILRPKYRSEIRIAMDILKRKISRHPGNPESLTYTHDLVEYQRCQTLKNELQQLETDYLSAR